MSDFDYWYAWYPAHFRADTMHLNPAEDGIYRRLIDHYMETRTPLPNHDAALARIAGISIEAWQTVKNTLLPFFSDGKKHGKDGSAMLCHKKCDEVLSKQTPQKSANSAIKSMAGKKGAISRWKDKDIVKPKEKMAPKIVPLADDGRAMANDSKGEERIVEDIKKESKATGSRFTLTELPEEWKAYCHAKRPDLNPQELFEEFRDYWIAVPGQRGRKLDWYATFRNRVRDKKTGGNNAINRQYTEKPSKSDRAKSALKQSAHDLGYGFDEPPAGEGEADKYPRHLL